MDWHKIWNNARYICARNDPDIQCSRDFSDGFDNGALFLLGLVLSLYCNFNCGLRSFSENYTTLTFITIYWFCIGFRKNFPKPRKCIQTYTMSSILDCQCRSSLLAKGFWSALLFVRSGPDQKPLACENDVVWFCRLFLYSGYSYSLSGII